ncbi:MAG: hypothetical protein P8R36_01360 [Actinomycetota bacterium]|nr:hypothetical protein [Actinomycetota bacterium]MDG1488914.1 hypothetical protein [Actinomycetota bacterium]MDG2120164.1 hypothetical protein [Actinomycetota bacterium]
MTLTLLSQSAYFEDAADTSVTEVGSEKRKLLARRFVSATAFFGGLTLLVLFVFAILQSLSDGVHFELQNIGAQIESERTELRKLQIELDRRQAPQEIFRWSDGVLGLVAADEPTIIRVDPAYISASANVSLDTGARSSSDWQSVKTLLTDAVSLRTRRG